MALLKYDVENMLKKGGGLENMLYVQFRSSFARCSIPITLRVKEQSRLCEDKKGSILEDEPLPGTPVSPHTPAAAD